MNAPQRLPIEVACATPLRQRIVKLDVQAGTNARQAVEASGLQGEFPELDIARLTLGIFGEAVADSRVLQAGDRVEIYRPLINEPRDARRLQVARARTTLARQVKKNPPRC